MAQEGQNAILESWKETGKNDKIASARAKAYQHRTAEELYDMENDPWELNNIAEDAKYQKIKKELRAELDKWMAQQGDKGVETELLANERKGNANKKKPAPSRKRKGNTRKK